MAVPVTPCEEPPCWYWPPSDCDVTAAVHGAVRGPGSVGQARSWPLQTPTLKYRERERVRQGGEDDNLHAVSSISNSIHPQCFEVQACGTNVVKQ